MRIAVIGTGWVTGNHLQAFASLADVEIVGIAGRNHQRLAELTAGTQTRSYEDYRQMVRQEKPDGVLLALPPHLHGEVEVFCAENVAAVLVEKPLAQSLEPVLLAQQAFRKAGTLVAVGYQNRYRQGALRARDFFATSKDKPILVQGWWVGDIPGPPWWRNKKESGGQFVEQCTHVVDLARFIVGDITEVTALGTSLFHTDPSITVEDAVVVNTRFGSGALGQFSTGCFVDAGLPAVSGIGLTITSRSAVVKFSTWGFEATLVEGNRVETFPSEPNIFAIQARAFVDAWKTGNPSLIQSDYADGMESLKVGLAANDALARS
jgi:predicted dehydrogenase